MYKKQLLDLAKVSELLVSLSRLTRRFVALLRTQNLWVLALAESRRFYIPRVSLLS